MPTLRTLVVAIAVAAAGPAAGQSNQAAPSRPAESGVTSLTGPLIAELIDYPDVRRVIPADTARRFAEICVLTPDQQTAAGFLIDAARADLARVINRHLRAVRDDPTLAQIRASEAEVLRNVAEVERRLLEDLRAALTPDQTPRFPAFERAHRRTLLPIAEAAVLPIDLPALLRAEGFDPLTAGGDEALAAALAEADLSTDAALVKSLTARLAYFTNVRAGYDNTPEGAETRRRIEGEFFRARAQFQRAQALTISRVIPRLPEALQKQAVRAIITRTSSTYDPTIADPDRFPVVREVRALPLQSTQRDALERTLAEARTEMFDLARACVFDTASYELMDNQARDKVPTAPNNVFLEKASKLRVRTSAGALALLTPEQRLLYDASPVLEPSTSSIVNDP